MSALTSPFVPGRCALIGMVHLLPLPGSPGWGGDMAQLLARAKTDAARLVEGGCDALLVENMGDLPYLRGAVEPATVAAMALATAAVVDLGLPTGVQVLAGANQEALGVAVAAGANFLRVEGFAYGHLADEGWLDACAGPLLRRRAALGAKGVQIFADVRKKHAAHAATADLSLRALCEGYAFCGADGLIITGESTGKAARLADVVEAKAAGLPVLVGSGITEANIAEFGAVADAVIVGTSIKVGGDWRAPVEVTRVRRLRSALDRG